MLTDEGLREMETKEGTRGTCKKTDQTRKRIMISMKKGTKKKKEHKEDKALFAILWTNQSNS